MIITSNLTTAQGSTGFEGNVIKLKVKLFQLNSIREIEAYLGE